MTVVSDELVGRFEDVRTAVLMGKTWLDWRSASRKAIEAVLPDIERPLQQKVVRLESELARLMRIRDEHGEPADLARQLVERDKEIQRLTSENDALRQQFEIADREIDRLMGDVLTMAGPPSSRPQFTDAEREALLDTIYDGCDCDECLDAYASARLKWEQGQ